MEDIKIDNGFDVVPQDWKPRTSTIKVIGVGGGGCNAVDYMYRQGVEGCEFLVCNTDSQALGACSVPLKIQLGEGLGAGTDPIAGRNAALESEKALEDRLFCGETDMLFITAGMGGGTGTGAAPVIATMAKKKGILTVGVVTIPFRNDGNEAMTKALDGIMEMGKSVDSLLIIDNEKLYSQFSDLKVHDAFPKADEVLCTAVSGILGIIKKKGHINVDFRDVKKMMTGSGMALMGCGSGTGKNRLEDAVKGAFESPLLNNYDLKTARNVLLNITIGRNEQAPTMGEFSNIDSLITNYIGSANRFKKGIVYDDSPEFGDRIDITAIATGFKMDWESLAGDNGNLIIVDPDFEYIPKAADSADPAANDSRSTKIGYNNIKPLSAAELCKGERPALLLDDKADRSELENTPALRRK